MYVYKSNKDKITQFTIEIFKQHALGENTDFNATNLTQPAKITAPMKTQHESLTSKATPPLLHSTRWGTRHQTPEACSDPTLTNDISGYCNSRWAVPAPVWAGLKRTALYFRCLRNFLLYHRRWQLATGCSSARKEEFPGIYIFSTFCHSVFGASVRGWYCIGAKRR